MVGGSLAPSDHGTWCPQGLLVLLGVGSRGRRGVLSGTPHSSELVSAVAVLVMQSDWTKKSLGHLSPLYQTDVGPTQGCSRSVYETIFPIGTDIMSSSGGNTYAV